MSIALAMSLHTNPLPFGLDATVSTNDANTPALYNLTSLIESIENYDTITGYLYTNESSFYDNNLLFYSVIDASGQIKDPVSGDFLTPADSGYMAAAKAIANENIAVINHERVSRNDGQLESLTLNLNGLRERDRGEFLAPLVMTSNGETWVPFAQANSDGQQHFLNTGILGWRVEDTYNLGDRDFNDLHVQLIITNLTTNLA